jgi:hypothetical protein
MRHYHTRIDNAAPPERVWRELVAFARYPEWNPLVGQIEGDFAAGGRIAMTITPLKRRFSATITVFEPNQALSWVGVQGATWVICGKHYYRLERLGHDATRLLHGEYFRGAASIFLGQSTLRRMEDVFNLHNAMLKARVEHG